MATDIEKDIKNLDMQSDTNGAKSAISSTLESKVDVPLGLVKRQEERVAKLVKARELRENEHVKQESADFFSKTFNEERSNIENSLMNASKIEKSELIGFFDGVTDAAHKLQKYVTDMSQFLPSYDIRSAQESVTKLLSKINEGREELLPKKRFQFKERKRGDGTQIKQEEKLGRDTVDAPQQLNITTGQSCGFFNRTSETLSLGSEEVYMKDISLSNLSSCTVQLLGCPSALHISNLSSCKVFCGPIPGSVFADKCVDSTLVLACQQLRVHNSKDTHFYVHVTSRAIIEDSTSVQFAPYNWSYEGLGKDYEQSGLDRAKNAWNDVDDFNWLAHDMHSPNWGILPEGKRVVKWE